MRRSTASPRSPNAIGPGRPMQCESVRRGPLRGRRRQSHSFDGNAVCRIVCGTICDLRRAATKRSDLWACGSIHGDHCESCRIESCLIMANASQRSLLSRRPPAKSPEASKPGHRKIRRETLTSDLDVNLRVKPRSTPWPRRFGTCRSKRRRVTTPRRCPGSSKTASRAPGRAPPPLALQQPSASPCGPSSSGQPRASARRRP